MIVDFIFLICSFFLVFPLFSVFTVIENGTAHYQPESKPEDLPVRNQLLLTPVFY